MRTSESGETQQKTRATKEPPKPSKLLGIPSPIRTTTTAAKRTVVFTNQGGKLKPYGI